MLDGWGCLDEADIARIEKGIIENHVYGGPYHIELHPTNCCDLNCFFCFSKPGRNNESLEWSVLKNLLIENRRHDLRMLHLTGGGDPLTYDHIDDLIDLCRAEGIKIQEITTNATRLASLAEHIVDAGLGRITVSLGETDAARYVRTMGGSKEHFHKAIEGIQAVVEARDHAPQKSRPRVWAMCMLWKGSAPYITQMYGFLRKLGVDTIFFRTIFGKMGNEKLAENERAMVESQLRDIIREDCNSKNIAFTSISATNWNCITSPMPNKKNTTRRYRRISRLLKEPIHARNIAMWVGTLAASTHWVKSIPA